MQEESLVLKGELQLGAADQRYGTRLGSLFWVFHVWTPNLCSARSVTGYCSPAKTLGSMLEVNVLVALPSLRSSLAQRPRGSEQLGAL